MDKKADADSDCAEAIGQDIINIGRAVWDKGLVKFVCYPIQRADQNNQERDHIGVEPPQAGAEGVKNRDGEQPIPRHMSYLVNMGDMR